jgi:uncharacterized protein (TIRG00374 family)
MAQIKKILQILIPLLLAALLFWLVYRKMDLAILADVFKKGLNYYWITFSVILSIISNILRGLRWHDMMEPICPGVRRRTAILGVFVSYAVNLLFPRAGEVARCGIINKSDGFSFTKTLGTVITERFFDAICLLILAIITILLQLGFFREFFNENPTSLQKIISLITSPYIWVTLVTLVLLVIFTRKKLNHTALYIKIHAFVIKLWEGMKTITAIKRPLLFVFYTVLIWLIYFIMFYIGKFFFPYEMEIGMLPMLSAFIMGTLGVLAPVQGGIGAYHFMVIYTMMFFGVSEPEAGVFALIVHGLQTVISLVTGFFAWILVIYYDKKVKRHENYTF